MSNHTTSQFDLK